VSVVLISHLVSTLQAHAGLQNIAVLEFTNQMGIAGVLAFFVHTSLVLMYSLQRLSRTEGHVTLRFYVRRFFRIYPLSIFCIALALVFHIPNFAWRNGQIITPRVVFANLLLVQNLVTKISVLGPMWSLPYEVQMYVVLPALYYLALRKRSILYLCGLLALSCCLGFFVSYKTGHLNMAAYIPCFICGVLCYSLRDRIHASISSTLWPLLILLLVTGYCLCNLHGGPNFWIGWIFCFILGVAINAFHDSTNGRLNFFAERVALYSYGIYLLHVPALYLVFMVLGIKDMLAGTLLFVALTTLASALTYHFIESPLIELGRKLSSRPARSPVVTTTLCQSGAVEQESGGGLA
jgi:peptidoglycan/LPS O-acetylase OafA/YrhL